MMLTFLAERLLQLSEAVVRRCAHPGSVGQERVPFSFGEMEIDSAPEWDMLVLSLAVVQLGALMRLLGHAKTSAEAVRAETVCKKVVESEKLAGELMERLRWALKPWYDVM